MNSIEPFIVEFKTQKGNRYIYDVTTNCIFPSSEIIIRILNNYKKLDKNSLIENLSHSYSKTEIEIAYQKISWRSLKDDEASFRHAYISLVHNQ